MRWARTASRVAVLLGAAHALATVSFLGLVITHAARTGSWATTVRFNEFGEGPMELVAIWALVPALVWLVHAALKHEFQASSGPETDEDSHETPDGSPTWPPLPRSSPRGVLRRSARGRSGNRSERREGSPSEER